MQRSRKPNNRGLLIGLLAFSIAAILGGCAEPDPRRGSSGGFALSGAHANMACAECHGETLDGAQTDCIACHEDVLPEGHYAGPCGDCHNGSDWGDAQIDHDEFFPIPHRGVSDCGDCHLELGDRSVFSCIDCHPHDRSEMDGEHWGMSGYSYESGACLSCHPRGRE